MKNVFLKAIAKVLIAPLIGMMALAGYSVQPAGQIAQPTMTVGATNPIETPIALFSTSLAAPITATSNSMTLVSGTTLDGTTLASSTYSFIIDEGQSNAEFVKADCTNTSCTNIQRGLSSVTGTSTITGLAQAHRRGATVSITDAPLLLNITNIINGIGVLPNPIQYATSVATTTLATNRSNIASVGLLQDTAFNAAGVINATTNAKGVVQIATPVQVASSTGTGSSGAILDIPASDATSTFNSVTAPLKVVVTQNNGTIDQGFLPAVVSKQITFSGGILNAAGSSVFKFGGTGADGALSVTSGTTQIDLGNAAIVVKNYTSISITGTGAIQFINPNAKGSVVVLKSQGNVTLTSSAAPMIDASGVGASGGTAVSGSLNGSGLSGTAGTAGQLVTSYFKTNGGAAPAANSTAAGGAIGTLTFDPTVQNVYNEVQAKYPNMFVGAGASSGSVNSSGSGSAASGPGGNGGGALIIEAAGSWNYTTTGGISVAGKNGTNGQTANTNTGAAGGGGGGGGSFLATVSSITSNTGSITVAAGIGGNCLTPSGVSTGGGAGGGSLTAAGNNSTTSGTNSTKNGGDGAVGTSYGVVLNTDFP